MLKNKHFAGALTASGANATLLMEREYFSANTDIHTLLMNIAKNHIELGYVFALQQLRNWDRDASDKQQLPNLKKSYAASKMCKREPLKEMLLQDDYVIKYGTFTYVLRRLLAMA